jgi:CMP-N-acetylneuraminic acid synthetase
MVTFAIDEVLESFVLDWSEESELLGVELEEVIELVFEDEDIPEDATEFVCVITKTNPLNTKNNIRNTMNILFLNMNAFSLF